MLLESQLESLRFPIGRWQKPTSSDTVARAADIATLAAFPARLRARLALASEAALDTPYRPDGWTVREVVHHCADSHMNCIIRIKLALTEEKPTIKPYAEELWALLPDYRMPVEHSLRLLESIHARLDHLLVHMRERDWAREYVHPQYRDTYTVEQVVSLYGWHCRHHFGHVALVVGE
jgi:DinB superfamily